MRDRTQISRSLSVLRRALRPSSSVRHMRQRWRRDRLFVDVIAHRGRLSVVVRCELGQWGMQALVRPAGLTPYEAATMALDIHIYVESAFVVAATRADHYAEREVLL